MKECEKKMCLLSIGSVFKWKCMEYIKHGLAEYTDDSTHTHTSFQGEKKVNMTYLLHLIKWR